MRALRGQGRRGGAWHVGGGGTGREEKGKRRGCEMRRERQKRGGREEGAGQRGKGKERRKERKRS